MSVKLYTPDANVIVHETKVDFRRRVVQRQVNLVQYDKSMPVIAVQLCSNGNEYVLPENASAYIRFGKRDHTYVYNECLGCDQTRTIVYFAITDQMTVFYGEHTPIVELRIGDTVAGSGSIPIWIDRNPIQNGDTESKSDLSVFEKAIEAAQKINAKLPTDLGASATNLHLLTGATKLGGGINLSGFEYNEATKTLKAKGGSSPCLNLINMEDGSVRTSITEDEKTNLENGLYNSVLYMDGSSPTDEFSLYLPEFLSGLGYEIFTTFNVSVDETAGTYSIVGMSGYQMQFGEKGSDGNYPITITKTLNAPFGGGGGSSTPSTSIAFKDVTVSELSNYNGKFENLHITDMKVKMTIFGSEQEFTGVNFSGTCSGTNLFGTAWLPQGIILGCGTFTFDTVTKTIKNGECSLGGTLSAVSVGNIFMPGAYTEFNSKYGADLIPTAIDIGSALFVGKAEINNASTQCIAYVGINNAAPTGDETWCFLTGMFGSKGFGVAEFKKGADGNPSFKSFTTWLPPITAADEGKALIVTGWNAKWTTTPRYEHTITIKNSAGKILWTQTMRNSSNTIVNSYTNLKTLFGEATYAGFGEYCQLNLEGGTEATDKLIKADGTEVTLASLGAIVYTDKCFLPK